MFFAKLNKQGQRLDGLLLIELQVAFYLCLIALIGYERQSLFCPDKPERLHCLAF
jgi:hypothetical protein